MSFETITVYRDFNIINGFVQTQPNYEGEKTAHTVDEFAAAVPGATQTQLAHPGTNPTTGSDFGAQEFMRVEGQTFDIDL